MKRQVKENKAFCSICGNEFNKYHRRQKYCSPKCANVAAWQKTVATEAGRQLARARNRSQAVKRWANGKAKAVKERWLKTDKGALYKKLHGARANQIRRSAAKTTERNFSAADWKRALSFFSNKCAYCDEPLNKTHQEHFTPLSKGGGYTKNNIIPACPKCNQSKGNKNPLDWLVTQIHGLVAYVRITQFLESFS